MKESLPSRCLMVRRCHVIAPVFCCWEDGSRAEVFPVLNRKSHPVSLRNRMWLRCSCDDLDQ